MSARRNVYNGLRELQQELTIASLEETDNEDRDSGYAKGLELASEKIDDFLDALENGDFD